MRDFGPSFFISLRAKRKFFMALTEDLPAYRATYELLNSILDVREHFPKMYKYEFGNSMMMTAIQCCELLRYANSDRSKRTYYLNEFLVKFDTVRLYLRICQDRRLITVKEATKMILAVDGVERQVRAWRNSTNNV